MIPALKTASTLYRPVRHTATRSVRLGASHPGLTTPARKRGVLQWLAPVVFGLASLIPAGCRRPATDSMTSPQTPAAVAVTQAPGTLNQHTFGQFYTFQPNGKSWVAMGETAETANLKHWVRHTTFKMLQNRPDLLAQLHRNAPVYNLYSPKLDNGGRSFYTPLMMQLSVADLRSSFAHTDDGYNIVIHETTHWLDSLDENGQPVRADGMLPGLTPAQQQQWIRGREIARTKILAGQSILGNYPMQPGEDFNAEVLAVGAERFFEQPRLLQAENPDMYQVYKEFFRLDPIQTPIF